MRTFAMLLTVLAALAWVPRTAYGQPPPIVLEFDTELVSMNLTGGPFPMPLASDPGNQLPGSIDGYGFVESNVELTLSSQRPVNAGPPSLGTTLATFPRGSQPPIGGFVIPDMYEGQQFHVDSFFDVFFDITVTDVDTRPGRDYAGQQDGASLVLPNNGPAQMDSFFDIPFDADAPNFGLIPPPETEPYIGHFDIEIPLGADINGNGENDKVKFTLATHTVEGQNRTFITLPDGTVIDRFDSEAFLEGAVVDESADPPFTIGPLTGPTTATSNLQNQVIPEPAGLVIWAIGLVGATCCARRRRTRARKAG